MNLAIIIAFVLIALFAKRRKSRGKRTGGRNVYRGPKHGAFKDYIREKERNRREHGAVRIRLVAHGDAGRNERAVRLLPDLNGRGLLAILGAHDIPFDRLRRLTVRPGKHARFAETELDGYPRSPPDGLAGDSVEDLAVRRELYGYFDDHLYVDHPRFPGKAWKLPIAHDNLNPVLDPDCRLDKHAYMRLAGLPSTVSEFNFCGPNDYRNMNALLTGAFMAGQDRSGYWRFAYAHSLSNMYDRVGRPGSFDVSTDPLNCAAERMVHFLYLRGDFAPFEPSVALVLPDARAATRGEKMSQMFPEWRQAFAWKARLACAFPADVPADARTVDHRTACGAAEAPFALADDPRLVVDRTAGTVRLTTARSCGVSVGRGKLAAGALALDVRRGGPMTTVGVASLDAAPLAKSRRLLLLHLTDADSSGATYADRTRKLKIAEGRRQTLIRDGEAEVRLALDDPSSFDVYGLDAAGRRTGTVAATVEDGALAFTARVRGERGARMCYEIVRKGEVTK